MRWFFVKLSFRNLWRHQKRSILTGTIVTLGTIVLVLSMALSKIVAEKMTRAVVENMTGDIQIHNQLDFKIELVDFSEDIKTFSQASSIRELILENNGVVEVAPRLRFKGMLAGEDEPSGAFVCAIDPLKERRVTTGIEIVEGRYSLQENEMMIGKQLAESAKAQPGDEFVLLAANEDGYLNGFVFRISGIYTTNEMSMFGQDYGIFVNINMARELLFMFNDQANELAVTIREGADRNQLIDEIQAVFDESGYQLQVNPWEEVVGTINGVIMGSKFMPQFIMLILCVVIGAGIINTILMAVLERTREIGMMLALGNKKSEIMSIFLLETGILSLVSTLIGLLAGGSIIILLNYLEIPINVDAMQFIFGGNRLLLSTEIDVFLLPFVMINILSIITTFFPARYIMKLEPVKALQTGV